MNFQKLFFKVIYQPEVNKVIRVLIKPLRNVLPKSFKLPPNGIVEFKLNNGNVIKMVTNQTSHVTWEIYWNGYENYEYVQLFEEIAPKVRVFLDIGSNIGFYSLIYASKNKQGKAYAFEPSPGPFHYLNQNIKLNNFSSQIEPVKLALTNEKGKTKFVAANVPKYDYLDFATLGGSGHISGARQDTSKVTFEVFTNRLDDYVAENNIKNIDFIKLDTEETEHLILQTGLQMLSKNKPIVVCEIFSNHVAVALNEIFIPLGYQIFKSKGKNLIATQSIEFDEGIIDNYFFVHPEKLEIIKSFIV